MLQINKYMVMKDLTVMYGNQKSYYGKAKVLFPKWVNKVVLRSYDTNVCSLNIDEQKVELNGYHSMTTNRHEWDFLNQFIPDFEEVYKAICESQKINSFKKFLEQVRTIDLVKKTYKVRDTYVTYYY